MVRISTSHLFIGVIHAEDLKILKPYLPQILLTILLLFVQANADLALPDYLSRIVNVGIQQNGVVNAVPQAIRKSQMDKVALFLNDADKTRVLANYTLVDQTSPNYICRAQAIPRAGKWSGLYPECTQ